MRRGRCNRHTLGCLKAHNCKLLLDFRNNLESRKHYLLFVIWESLNRNKFMKAPRILLELFFRNFSIGSPFLGCVMNLISQDRIALSIRPGPKLAPLDKSLLKTSSLTSQVKDSANTWLFGLGEWAA